VTSLPTPIKELIEDGVLFIGDGYRAKNSELAPSGLPFARVQNINNGFQLDEVDHFPVADLHRVGNKISEPGDVVFTSKGSVGRFAFVRDTTPRFVYSPQLCFWRVLDRRRINPQWLFYWMQSREYSSFNSQVLLARLIWQIMSVCVTSDR
jgi:type I restriction enzyme S subunit